MAQEEETAVLSIPDAISARHSVRQFLGPLTPERAAMVEQIISDCQKIPVPFSTDAQIANHPPGIGRFAVISKEAGWIIAKIPQDSAKDVKKIMDACFRIHVAHIRMTQQRLGGVWIAGTYDQKKAEKAVPGFRVPVCVAYGEDSNKKGLVERLFKWISSSESRKPLHELFFDGLANKPITEDQAGDKLPLVRALQSAPSARNGQPWRFLVVGNLIHLYNASPKDEVTYCDMGIALATAHLFVESTGSKLEFSVVESPPGSPLGGTYVATMTIA
jgi:hypothetical protein